MGLCKSLTRRNSPPIRTVSGSKPADSNVSKRRNIRFKMDARLFVDGDERDPFRLAKRGDIVVEVDVDVGILTNDEAGCREDAR